MEDFYFKYSQETRVDSSVVLLPLMLTHLFNGSILLKYPDSFKKSTYAEKTVLLFTLDTGASTV